MANKAEKFVKRAIEDCPWRITHLDERERCMTKVWFAVDDKLGRPTHWPAEYSKAYQEAFKD